MGRNTPIILKEAHQFMSLAQTPRKLAKSVKKERRPLIEIQGLTKEFDGSVVLKGMDLTIYENEFVTLLGPSGCGKTTTLRILGGFEEPTSGKIIFDGKEITTIRNYDLPTNTVFQRYALFPHLNVFENIAFGLRIKQKNASGWRNRIKKILKRPNVAIDYGFSEEVIAGKVQRMLKLVNLEGYEQRSVTSLSGGQQQRVAIARALINEPKVLLLDEPLGALDLKLRQEMQYELKDIQINTGITFIFVTHDQEEALTMSDKIVIMKEGEIQQVGTPEDVYNEPINEYVAKFIGESNIIDGTMIHDYLVSFDGQEFKCVDRGFSDNEAVDVVIRPEDLDIVEPSEGLITGVVDSVIFKGVHFEIDVKTPERIYTVHTTDQSPEGKKVGLRFNPEDLHVMEKMTYAGV